MKKIISLSVFFLFLIGCSSESNVAEKTKSGDIKQPQITKQEKQRTEWKRKFEEAKKDDDGEIIYKLAEEALEKSDMDSFEEAAGELWDLSQVRPEFALARAFMKIETKEDYIKYIKITIQADKKEREEEAKKKKEDEAQIAKQTISVNQPLKLGGIEFIAESIERKKLKLMHRNFSGENWTTDSDEVLCINSKTTNITEGQVFEPISSGLLEKSFYIDEFNNKHEYSFENLPLFTRISDSYIGKEFKPGEIIKTCIAFEIPKVDNSKEFTADIYLVKSNNPSDSYLNSFASDRENRTKAIILKFTRSDISTNQ